MIQNQVARVGIVVGFAVAILMVGAVETQAEEGEEMSPMAHAEMTSSSMMEEDMMSMHKMMQAKVETMDGELADLVAEMNTATGERKTDAIAAVVSELVEQRGAMRGMMMTMQPAMMQHMMGHMASGMKQNMASCPMMQQPSSSEEADSEAEHSAHHPDR